MTILVGCGALQPQRVYEHVEKAGAQGQDRRQQVHLRSQQCKRSDIQHDAESQRVAGRHSQPRHRTPLRSSHVAVDVPIQEMVHRVGAPGRQRASRPDQAQQRQGRYPLLREEHPSRRGHQQQRNDFGLGQRRKSRATAMIDVFAGASTASVVTFGSVASLSGRKPGRYWPSCPASRFGSGPPCVVRTSMYATIAIPAAAVHTAVAAVRCRALQCA